MSRESESSGKFDSNPEVQKALESIRNPAIKRNSEQLEAASLAMMKAAMEEMENHPCPDQDLEDERTARVEARDWPAVLGCIQRLSDNAAARGENHQVYRNQQTLSQYLLITGNREAAREAARRATEAARQRDGTSFLIGAEFLEGADEATDAGIVREERDKILADLKFPPPPPGLS